MKGQPAAWFENTINDGLQALVALRLQGQPAADTLGMTLDVWSLALWRRGAWNEDRDQPRFVEAFVRLAGHAEKWPAPAEVIRHLPELPQVKRLPPVERCPETPERVASIVAGIMGKNLANKRG